MLGALSPGFCMFVSRFFAQASNIFQRNLWERGSALCFESLTPKSVPECPGAAEDILYMDPYPTWAPAICTFTHSLSLSLTLSRSLSLSIHPNSPIPIVGAGMHIHTSVYICVYT